MNDPQRVAVVGATGYAGFELAQLLLRHPKIQKPTFYLRESSAHVKCLTEIFPHLRGWGEAPCKTFSVDADCGERSEHGVSRDAARSFAGNCAATFERGLARGGPERRVPLPQSGNVRALVQIAGAAQRTWRKKPCTVCRSCMPINLPEARLVANPGCYPTSVILGLRPLVESGWIATRARHCR